MIIDYRKHGNKWLTEIWDDPAQKLSGIDDSVPLPEEQYVEINQWCIDSFGYHARTSYHVFEFKKEKDLTMFLLRWL
jgi:hypothetical protein